MKKTAVILCLAFCLILPAAVTEAFFPEPLHLLYMVVQKIKRPASLQVEQVLLVPSVESDPTPAARLSETLIYKPSEQVRSDITCNDRQMVSVESSPVFASVTDGRLIAMEKSAMDRYTDVLLSLDHEVLLHQLEKVGVDLDMGAFRRYNDRICYVLGRRPDGDSPLFPSLWIEKDSLFPVRYIVTGASRLVEFVYDNWQQVSKTWYPTEIQILVDGSAVVRMVVTDLN